MTRTPSQTSFKSNLEDQESNEQEAFNSPSESRATLDYRPIRLIVQEENVVPSEIRNVKRTKVSPKTAHVSDHSITATEVSAQILADGIDVTQTGQGCDILKQYLDTFFGPVPGFQLNIQTGA